jgi:hypothetical protein
MQVTKKLILVIGVTSIFFQGCVYDFYPKLSKYDNALVVYGAITNENGPHEIKLSRSTTINGYSTVPETGATLTINDNRGNTIQLTDQGNGLYNTPQTFAGEIGVKYKLSITLKNGKKYESDFVQLMDVPDLTNLRAELGVKQATQTSKEAPGYQFYIDMDASKTTQKYYRWEMSDTWEILMPFVINFYWDGDTLIYREYPSRCWRSSKVQEFYIANANDFDGRKISNFPITFTTNESEKLRIKYSLDVKQFALSEESYYFWKGMLDNSQQLGTLFDRQPYQVIGNMKNVDDPGDIVLGIFEASEVKIKRLIIDSRMARTPSSFEYCKKTLPTELTESQKKYPYWAHISFSENYVVVDERCADCTKSGSSAVMPDYWE